MQLSSSLGTTLAERRMALRMSREQAAITLPSAEEPETASSLPSVRRALGNDARGSDPVVSEGPVEGGDDDEADAEPLDEDDFYADALEDV